MTPVARLLLYSLRPCGQTTHVVDLARGLASRGWPVEVVLAAWHEYRDGDEVYGPLIEEAGASVARFARPAAAAAYLGRHGGLLHAHDSRTFALAASLTRRSGKGWLATCHGAGLSRAPFVDALGAAATVIAVSPSVADELRRAGLAAVCWPNAVDLTRFQPAHAERCPLRILYCGRVDASKERGFLALCAAVETLPTQVTFTVAGNQPPIGGRGRYLGWLADPSAAMATHHVVVGTERAIREGMASGCACLVLGQGWGGLVDPEMPDEACWNGVTGTQPPTTDAIAHALGELARNPHRVRALGCAGRRCAEERFGLEAWLDRHEGAYRRLLTTAV